MREFFLSSTDHGAVKADMKRLIPGWTELRGSPINDVSFRRDIEVVTPPMFDEEDNEIAPAVISDKLIYWVYCDFEPDLSGLTTVQEGDCSMRY